MSGSPRLEAAVALLAKARSSQFEPERVAFAAGALKQISAFLGGEPYARRPGWRQVASAYDAHLPTVRIDLEI